MNLQVAFREALISLSFGAERYNDYVLFVKDGLVDA